MPATSTLINDEPTVAADHGGFELVLSTTHPTPKDRTDAFYHTPRAPLKCA